MIAELIALRLIHILAGTFWVGTTLFTVFFLFPAMREAGPAAAPVMGGFQKRKLMVFIPIAAILTLLSGLRLIWLISGGFDAEFFAAARGQMYSASGGLAIIAFLFGMAVNRPANVRMGMIAQKMPTAEPAERDALQGELQRLRARAARAGMVVTALLVLATAGMAVARYI